MPRKSHNKIYYEKGEKIGSCVYINEEPPIKFNQGHNRRVALFKCECGKEFTCMIESIKAGNTTSCGCKFHGNNGSSRTHGHSTRARGNRSPEFIAWQGMLGRCGHYSNPVNNTYTRRGITVCEEWINSFEAFLRDMGERPSKEYSIDRINNDLGYFKENCRWATRYEQNRNKSTNRKITFNGETLCLRDWSNRLEIDFTSLSYRLDNWSIEKALTTPPKHLKKIVYE